MNYKNHNPSLPPLILRGGANNPLTLRGGVAGSTYLNGGR